MVSSSEAAERRGKYADLGDLDFGGREAFRGGAGLAELRGPGEPVADEQLGVVFADRWTRAEVDEKSANGVPGKQVSCARARACPSASRWLELRHRGTRCR